MTEAQAAVSLDRLPWLPDEPPARRHGVPGWAWLLAAIAIVAAASYWLGFSATHDSQQPAPSVTAPSQTVPLPPAQPAQRVEPVEPVVAPPISIVEQPARQPSIDRTPIHRAPIERVRDKPVQPVVDQTGAEPKAVSPATEPAKPKAEEVPQIWPVRVVEGASGRLVRIGAFSSVHQAKRGWWAVVRLNPALKRLPALVVPVRSRRNGKLYYRLQMGTTSQAHSAVLCQRMRMIAQSCVVIGLNGVSGEVAM